MYLQLSKVDLRSILLVLVLGSVQREGGNLPSPEYTLYLLLQSLFAVEGCVGHRSGHCEKVQE